LHQNQGGKETPEGGARPDWCRSLRLGSRRARAYRRGIELAQAAPPAMAFNEKPRSVAQPLPESLRLAACREELQSRRKIMNCLFHRLRRLAKSVLLMMALTAASMSPALADLLVGGNGEQVYRYDDRTGAFLGILVPNGSGGLNDLQGMTVGPDRRLYMTSFNTHQVLRFDGRTTSVFIPASNNEINSIGRPDDVKFGPDGNAYVADWDNNRIVKFDGKTGAFISVFATGNGLQEPNRIAFGPTGDLYVGNAYSTDVLRFHGGTGEPYPAAGQSGAIFVPGVPGPFNVELDVSSDGILAVTQGATNGLRFYDARTGALLGVPDPGLTNVSDMRFGPDGDLYLTVYANAAVLRYEGRTGTFLGQFVTSGSGGLNRAISMTFTCARRHNHGHGYGTKHCPGLEADEGADNDTASHDKHGGLMRLPF
jgi:WD40 repeat protein